MPKKKYVVTLTDDERTQLQQLLRGGKAAIRKVTRARILLKASDGWHDQRIAEALNIGRATVERTRRRFVEENLAALDERPRPGNKPKLDARAEARLIAEACSAAPDGQKRWTLSLLADRVVQLKLAESYSYEAVRRVLKKTSSSRG
jgi:transposase